MHKLLSYHYIYLIPLTLSSLVSLRAFRLEWLRPYRIFSLFLITSLMIEAFAISWKWGLHQTAFWNFPASNIWIYNIFMLVQLLFLAAGYNRLLGAGRPRKLIRAGWIPLILFGIADFFYFQGPGVLNNLTIILYYLIFVLLALAFFYQVLHAKELVSLVSHPGVWISLGIFIYYSVALPYCIFLPYLVRQNLSLAVVLFNINVALDTLMYSLYLISFLCKPRFLKSAS
ncbi:hypothetical protein ACFFGT_32355 [Mucilaginibacter angelicae]|uniref:Lycopene cyclase domain-containing protein n=1 Tax=Mucilaginibacter angelicae TaxID=869718 RepID=A0ABV6LHJ3_9SPHI